MKKITMRKKLEPKWAERNELLNAKEGYRLITVSLGNINMEDGEKIADTLLNACVSSGVLSHFAPGQMVYDARNKYFEFGIEVDDINVGGFNEIWKQVKKDTLNPSNDKNENRAFTAEKNICKDCENKKKELTACNDCKHMEAAVNEMVADTEFNKIIDLVDKLRKFACNFDNYLSNDIKNESTENKVKIIEELTQALFTERCKLINRQHLELMLKAKTDEERFNILQNQTNCIAALLKDKK